MKRVLLKLIIILAFVGIFVVGGIIFIKNRNIDCMAFDTITLKIKETDFKTLSNGANSMKDSYEGSVDEYAVFVDDIIEDLNDSIDFYLDYLVNLKEISRGEQDLLINEYLAYVEALQTSKASLDHYNELYSKAGVEVSIQKQISAANGNFVKEYSKAYGKGSQFFKSLVGLVNKYVYGKHVQNDYVELLHIINNAVADTCTSFIEENMNKRTSTGVDIKPLSACAGKVNYDNLASSKDTFNKTENLTNTELGAFIVCCGDIDVVKLITKKSEYQETLKDEDVPKVEYVLNFLSNNFAVAV